MYPFDETPTPVPTKVIPTLTPTLDTRPQEDIYNQARQLYANKDWNNLFATIDELEAATQATGSRVEDIAAAAEAVRESVDAAGRTTALTCGAARTLDQLVGQFKVSAA